MNSEIKVSVIVPVYNVEPYLRQCLSSLDGQTLPEMEFLVVNDGSTDKSGEIAKEFSSGRPRFRFLDQRNKGYAGARNAALPLVRGKYIGFVDSDDWIEPDMFEKLYFLAEKQNADISGCSYLAYFQRDGVSVPFDNSAYVKLLKRSGGVLFGGAEACLFDSAVTWNKLYRRDLLERYRIRFAEQLKMAEDVPVFWESFAAAKRIALTTECLYHYRNQRPGQQVSFQDRRLFSFFPLFDEFEGFLRRNGISGLDPWILHLKLSRFCYGYENILPEYREEYFERIRKELLSSGVRKGSPIAAGCLFAGGFSERMRSLLLTVLHPAALRAVLRNDRKSFERIVMFRKNLSELPRKIRKLWNPQRIGVSSDKRTGKI